MAVSEVGKLGPAVVTAADAARTTISKTGFVVVEKLDKPAIVTKLNSQLVFKLSPRTIVTKIGVVGVLRERPATARRRKLQLGFTRIPTLIPWPDPRPGGIVDLVIVGSPTTTTITLGFTPVQYATFYEYRLDNGEWVFLPLDRVIRELTPGTLYSVQVRAGNGTGLGVSSNIVEVTTIGLALPVITSPASSNAVEGTPFGQTVTANVPATFSVTGTDASAVTLDPVTGVWTLEATDFETQPSYQWTFVATDPNGNVATQAYVHTVIDNVSDNTYPLVAVTAGGTMFDGYTGSFTMAPKNVVTDGGMSYSGSGGVAPYSYEWELFGDVTLIPHGEDPYTDGGTVYAFPTNSVGGYTKFHSNVDFGYTMKNDLRCTITDAVGSTVSFVVKITLTHADLR